MQFQTKEEFDCKKKPRVTIGYVGEADCGSTYDDNDNVVCHVSPAAMYPNSWRSMAKVSCIRCTVLSNAYYFGFFLF